MMILHDYELSADCYAVRLLAALLAVELDLRLVEMFPSRQHESARYRSLDPLSRVPLLEDGALRLGDAQAMLIHLATQPGVSASWYPSVDAATTVRLAEMLGLARELGASAGLARMHDSFNVPADMAACHRRAHHILGMLERTLWFGERSGDLWLCGAVPTVADIAIFPHVALSEEGGVDRRHYPAVRLWLDRVRKLPGFIVMPGVFGI